MAGDWIKFRPELLTHPKFIRLVSILGGSNDAMRYVTDGGSNAGMDCVTDDALRCVTLALLLQVWCAVNSHGRSDGQDVVCRMMTLDTIDTITGICGFGSAMVDVEWVREDDSQSLRFPNFMEHNKPSSARSAPKTNAERQRAYRERQRTKNQTVTNRNESNGREEKRRKEKKREEGEEARALLSDFGPDQGPDLAPPAQTWAMGQIVEGLLDLYPRQGRRSPGKARRAIAEAVEVIEARMGSRAEALSFLETRIRTYAKSDIVTKGKVRNACAWFSDGDYDADASAWADTNGTVKPDWDSMIRKEDQ